MIAQAGDRGFARTFTSRHIEARSFSAERDHSLHLMRELVERARSARTLRDDITMDDILLALMANSGIRAERRPTRLAAAQRLSALLLRSFSARQEDTALPPSVPLPLPRP